jgi:hypothetical protein
VEEWRENKERKKKQKRKKPEPDGQVENTGAFSTFPQALLLLDKGDTQSPFSRKY